MEMGHVVSRQILNKILQSANILLFTTNVESIRILQRQWWWWAQDHPSQEGRETQTQYLIHKSAHAEKRAYKKQQEENAKRAAEIAEQAKRGPAQ